MTPDEFKSHFIQIATPVLIAMTLYVILSGLISMRMELDRIGDRLTKIEARP